MVALESGQVVRMINLKIGDRVQVGPNEFSPVFMFTHKSQQTSHGFLIFRTGNDRRMVEVVVTGGHYLYVNGRLATARSAKVSDTLLSADEEPLSILSITKKTMRSLYNPQTVHGDIVVNGVIASTYTDTIVHDAAQAMFAPFRALYTMNGLLGRIAESSM